MKKVLIPINSTIKLKVPREVINKKIGLLATSQYINQLKEIKIPDSIYGGQVLGCNVSNALKIKDKIDVFFILTEGRFHALEVAFQTKKPTYTATGDKITEKDIEGYEKKKKGLLNKFFAAKKIGILVSTKPGQFQLKQAEQLKKKIKKPCYIFIDNTFDIPSLEDFNDVDIFINTACSRIESKNIIQMRDLHGFI